MKKIPRLFLLAIVLQSCSDKLPENTGVDNQNTNQQTPAPVTSSGSIDSAKPTEPAAALASKSTSEPTDLVLAKTYASKKRLSANARADFLDCYAESINEREAGEQPSDVLSACLSEVRQAHEPNQIQSNKSVSGPYAREIRDIYQQLGSCKPRAIWVEYLKYPKSKRNQFLQILCAQEHDLYMFGYFYDIKSIRGESKVTKNGDQYIAENGDWFVIAGRQVLAYKKDKLIGQYRRID